MNFKSYSDLSADIKDNLHIISDKDFDLIVGIPRSGMVPAYMLALYLNIDVLDLAKFCENAELTRGNTRNAKHAIRRAWDARRVLFVDDSILSGRSFADAVQKVPADCHCRIETLAIYSSEKFRQDVDYTFSYLPMPRIFEWNVFHHQALSDACVDIDGVLCVDPTELQNDDGECYRQFLLNAQPLFIPTAPISVLVTNRLEKYRSETEFWLKQHGVEYDKLVMLDLPSKAERQRLGIHAKNKADYFRSSNHQLFIESEAKQAQYICKRASKAVYCVDNGEFYSPSNLMHSVKKPDQALLRVYHSLPISIKRYARAVFRFMKAQSYSRSNCLAWVTAICCL